MNINTNANYYRTDSIALAPYLQMKDLKYCVGELDNSGKVYFVFNDPKDVGKQLSLEFEKSNLSVYNKIWRNFRAELDKNEPTSSLKNNKEKVNYYFTDRLALVPYLVMRELKYSHLEQNGRRKLFYFEDPLHIGQELLMDFEKSEESTYNKYWHIFRREVDETKKNVRMGLENPRALKRSRPQVSHYE